MTERLRAFQAQVFQALAHPTRIAIVEALRNGDVSAGALPGRLQIEAAQVSTHLTVLRTQRIVQVHNRDNQVYYSLSDPLLLRVVDLIKQSFFAQLGQSAAGLPDENSER